MARSLHPDILFHFTSKSALFEILRTTFKVSYAREKIIGPTQRREFGVPMVSFCDLKLSELKKMIEDDYGKFGIGLSKEWANRNGLNPVMYISKHCALTDGLINGVDGIHQHLEGLTNMNQITAVSQSYLNIMDMYRYIKNYDGELERANYPLNENYRFADDREWRYVPNIDSKIKPFVPITTIRTKAQKQELNASINSYRLSFEPEDIKYLIVEKDEQRIDLIHHLEQVKHRFDEVTRRRLSSRILTIDQILNDI
jgi:hypothetical protein